MTTDGDLASRFALPAGAAAGLDALLDLIAADDHAPTTVRDPRQGRDTHLADSLVGLEIPEVRAARTIADLGAGAGFPGIPLARALPLAHVSLVESAARKCAFLERAILAAGAGNAVVVHARAEAWPEGIGAQDVVTARALAPLAVLAEYAAPLLRPAGVLVAWKGRRDAGEEATGARAAEVLGLAVRPPVRVEPAAGLGARHLHVFDKVAETPGRFPRRPGMARKRPLGAWVADPTPTPTPTPSTPPIETDGWCGKPAPSGFCGEPGLRLTASVATVGRAMGTVYAIANQKGGVGKTTTAVNVSACVAEAGYPTLIVDLDPQCNATVGLGVDKTAGPSVYDVIAGRCTITEAMVDTAVDHLTLVPSSPDLAGASIELPRMAGSDTVVRTALAAVREDFAFTFLDCPPSLGPLTVAALAAADRVIVPVQTEYFALEGLAGLLDTVALIQRDMNPRLRISGMLLTMHDGRTRLAEDVEHEVREHFPDLVFDTVIPRNVRLAEAPSFGRPVIHHDPHCAGADAYFALAKEVAARG